MLNASTVRALLQPHGELRPQDARDWTGEFQLPASLASFYAAVGPVDLSVPGYGNDYFLPALAGLWDFQAGYRWHATTRAPLPDWDDDWLVVADEALDPFILSRSSGAVLRAIHGQGTWEPDELFPDVPSMAACLGILGTVVAEAGEAFADSAGSIEPVCRRRAETELRRVLGPRLDIELVLATLGWG